MLIVADRNIPQAEAAFAAFGEVRLVDGRSLDAAAVRAADILLVRSVTAVNAALLAGSRIKFVGSATIGTDHVDVDYLRNNGIKFAYAPGSNARAVAEYVLSAILTLCPANSIGRVGIIGYGNTGSRLARLLDTLNIDYLINDPPLQSGDINKNIEFVSLAEIRRSANIISLHVPLIKKGPHPTYHLIDTAFLRDLSAECLLINTSRGEVMNNTALAAHLECNAMRTVLDVWEGEPAIDVGLLSKVSLGTPHIAGYSLEGRLNGTRQIYNALCAFLDVRPAWDCVLPAQKQMAFSSLQGLALIRDLVLQACDIRRDDAQLRSLIQQPPAERAAGFDRLRREYPSRREFSAYRCQVGSDPLINKQLIELGFELEE